MIKLVVVIVMIAASIITSVVYHVTQKADIEYYQGHRYFEKAEYSKALPFYHKSLAINPSHIAALRDVGRVYQWTGEYSQAIGIFRKILSIKPEDNTAKKGLAETLSWQKEYPEAIKLLSQVIDATGDAGAMLDLAGVYQWDGQFAKSREVLKKLPPARANEVRSRLLYAKALLYTGDVEKAAGILEGLLLENAVKKDRKLIIETEKLLAEASMLRKDYADAIERCRKQVKDDPQDIKSRIMLADMLSWVKRYDESITEYKKVLQIEPGNLEVKAKLARVYSWAKEYASAEMLLKEVLAAEADDTASRILLADILGWQKRYSESIAEYEKALQLDAGDAETIKKLADTASWAKDYEKAERIYGILLMKDPNNAKVRIALARVLSWQKKYAASITEYEKILAAEPENIEIKNSLAQVYSWDKKYSQAERLYREVIAKEPDNISARIALGELLLWQKRHREAVEYFKSLLAERNESRVRFMYGEALLYSGDYKASREIFSAIIAAEPDNVSAKVFLADSYAYNKEFARAIELYEHALRERPDRETKRKLADVLSWAKRYDRSFKLYDELLAEEEDDKIWLQKARVLGWARRYPEALREYQLLVDKTKDPVIACEMDAKRAYWNDRVEGAISGYGKLIKDSPDNAEAMFDLSQICSYQSMWKEAIDEYHRILKLEPNHFRAREGLEKAELIAHHPSWDSGYEFYEGKSQSRDMDVRRHTILNKFSYPVNYHIIMDGIYNFTARSFADFPDVIEDEGRMKLAYIFNPKAYVDGFYDIIAYDRDISPMHTFGGSAHLRVIDAALAHFWYKRERLENTSTVIRSHYYSDDFKERLDVSIDKRLKLGVDYLYSSVSDDNQRWEPGFDILYYLSLDPLRLTVQYRYFYRQFEHVDPDYFSPKGFTTNAVTVNWRHFLNKDEIFFGADDLYYDASYTFSVDSTSIVGHLFRGGIHWDINKRLALDVNGGFSVSSNNVYRESGVKTSLKYYY